jgi:ubiquitin-protein ligase
MALSNDSRLRYMQREYAAVAKAAAEGAYRDAIVVIPSADFAGYEGVVTIDDATSPWYGGAFGFTITLPTDYPQSMPHVYFDEPLQHPNVDEHELDISHVSKDISDPFEESILSHVLANIIGMFEITATGATADGSNRLVATARDDVQLRSIVPLPEASGGPGMTDEEAHVVAVLADEAQTRWIEEVSAAPCEADGATDVATQEQLLADRFLTHIVRQLRR